jgi:hypothetical protein
MANTAVADLDSIIQVVVAETRLTARHAVPMANLVTRVDMPEHRGSPFDLPKLDTLTAIDLTEGVDYDSFETVTDTDVSIDPTEVGIFVMLTDRSLRRAPVGFERLVSGEASRAYAYKLDLDLLRQLSSFSVGLAGAGNVLQIGHLSAGRSRVKGGIEPGQGPVHVILHPFGIKDLVDDLVPTAATMIGSGISDDITRQYLTENFVGTTKIYGMAIWEDGNIPIDANDDAQGGLFCENAIFLAVTLEPTEETERNASARGDELVIVGEYGIAEWLDAAGIGLLHDATVPIV